MRRPPAPPPTPAAQRPGAPLRTAGGPRTASAPCAAAALLATGVVLACGTPVVAVDIAISTKACDGALLDPSRDPVAGVDSLRLRVTGEGISEITVDAPFSGGSARVPDLPLGTGRRVVVEARKGLVVRARADSGRFDLLDGHDLRLSLQLRVVDAFTLAGRAGGGACSRLANPRAGHAMTSLPDGRVLITGGYSVGSDGLLRYQRIPEIYDPAEGSFTALSATPSYQRMGHAAFAVSLGGSGTGVVLGGGEGPSDSGPLPVKPFELFRDGAWSVVQPPAASPAREHQAAALDVHTGYAVFAGGLAGPDVPGATVLDSLSWYDAVQGAVFDSAQPLAMRLSDAAAVSRANSVLGGPAQGGLVLLGGRTAAGDATGQISGVVFDPAQHTYRRDVLWETPPLAALPSPRVRHFAARLQDDSIVVVGGLTAATVDYASATAAVTVVDAGGGFVADAAGALGALSQGRADGCGALLEDGSVLFAGGAFKDTAGTHSSKVAEVVLPSGRSTTVRALIGPAAGSQWVLQQARHRAACLRLADGTVLVTGGLQFPEGGGLPATLDSAEVYTPAGCAAGQAPPCTP